MVMNGFDTNFDADNEVYAVNTVAHHFMHEPIRVTVGALVRIYLVNVTEFDLVNSLHLHGMFFDAYRTGTASAGAGADRHGDAVPGRTGDPRDTLPVSGSFHVPRAPERVRGAWLDGHVRGGRERVMIPETSAATSRSFAGLGRCARPAAAACGARPAHRAHRARRSAALTRTRHRSSGSPSSGPSLSSDGIVLSVLNDGPDPVTIAQVTVDDAFWAFTADGGTTLRHLGSHVDRDSLSVGDRGGASRQAADVDRHGLRARDPGRGQRSAGRSVEPRAVHADRPLRRRDPCGARTALVSARVATGPHRARRAAGADGRPAGVSAGRCRQRRAGSGCGDARLVSGRGVARCLPAREPISGSRRSAHG